MLAVGSRREGNERHVHRGEVCLVYLVAVSWRNVGSPQMDSGLVGNSSIMLAADFTVDLNMVALLD